MPATVPNLTRAQIKAARVTTAAATLVPGRVYIHSGAAADLTLPVSAQVGARITIVNAGSGIVTIKQNAGQTIRHLTSNTTVGTGGSLASGTVRDVIELICTTQDTTWTTMPCKGTLVVT